MSAIKKVILAKKYIQDVPIITKNNIWDFLDGAARVEMEELKVQIAGKKPQGGSNWPNAAVESP